MALSLITSYFVQQNTTTNTALVTPSFTPSNGEVIIVKLGTWDTGTAMGAPTGGSQTYTSRVINAPGGFNAWCGIYSAVISGSPGSMTISSTPVASARYSMTVERWSGAQLAATPVTDSAHAGGAAAASTITPAAATSVISWCSGDAGSIDPATRAYLGSGTDEGVRDGHAGSNGVEYYADQNAVSTSSQSYGLSAPGGQTFVIAAIEVQAAASATATFPPNPGARRRPRAPRRRPVAVTPVRAQQNPPFPFTGVKQPRELRGLLPRRTKAITPVPAQIVVTPLAFIPAAVRSKVRGLLRRRPAAVAPIPAQQAVTPLSCPAQSPRLPRRALLRRARSAGSPPADQQRPPAVSPPRRRIPFRRRPGVAAPVPAQAVAPTAPAYPPASVRSKIRGLLRRRPAAVTPVPPQVAAPAAPSYPSQSPRLLRRALSGRRSRAAAPLIDQQLPPAPPAARRRFLPRRRPAAAGPVPAQIVPPVGTYAPQSVRSKVRGLLSVRRGRGAAPVPPQIVIPPPAYPPQPVHARWRNLFRRRGRSAAPVPSQVVIPPPLYPVRPSGPRRRGMFQQRGATFMPTPPQEIEPTPPPPPPEPVKQGSWYSLLSVLREDRIKVAEPVQKVCPNDGEPLRLSVDGIWYCPFDRYILGGTPPVRGISGQDWGGIRGVLNAASADATQDIGRRTLACPNCGEPLSRNKDGIDFCRFDGYRPDGGEMPPNPDQ